MSKYIITALVVFISATHATAEIYDLTIEGEATVARTLHLCFSGVTNGVSQCPGVAHVAGTTGLELRNALVPEPGVNLGGSLVGRVHRNGVPAMRGVVPSKAQYWFSVDNVTYVMLEPSIPVIFNGFTLTAYEQGTSSNVIQGIIPAVSTWGLGILGLLILVTATLVMARRREVVI